MGHSVTVIDDLSTGFREAVPAEAAFVQLDIGDRAGLESLLAKSRFDVVFHFAARAVIPESVASPGIYFQKNVAASIVMLEALRAAGISNFVFSSSAAVYGIPSQIPIDEGSSKKPVNSYGESKLILEQVLEWYARAYQWTVFAFRYFNAAGATDELGERHSPETHVIPLVLEAAAGEREYFTIFGEDYDTPDGTCLRDYVHVRDIAQAHIAALQRLGDAGMRSYNIGLGESYSVRKIVEVARSITGRPIPVQAGRRREGDPPVLWARPDKIKSELGWRPKHSDLEEIIGSAWRWKSKQLTLSQTATSRE
jgi:UDP-glucose 4-epimerase